MTNIIRLSDDQGGQIPRDIPMSTYLLKHDSDDVIALEKFLIRFGHIPEKAWIWRNTIYIQVEER